MAQRKTSSHPLLLLKSSVQTLWNNPLIFYPFVTVAFIQLLVLEILYFSPRVPLVNFFGPLIRRMAGEAYVHYPYNFIVLPKFFQDAQILIFLFISSFFIASAINIISDINNDKKGNWNAAMKKSGRQYFHVVVAASVSLLVLYGVSKGYGLLIKRALQLRSTAGIFYLIKVVIVEGTPYLNLLFGVFVNSLFAFVLPLVMIDRKNVFVALVLNFVKFWKSFFYIFIVILIPTFFYVPVLLLTNGISLKSQEIVIYPEIYFWLIVFSVVVMTFIDAVTYTAITSYFLLKKEEK